MIEKIPMNDGSFIRIIVAPSIRMLNSTISTGGVTKNYYKLFLPVLDQGTIGTLSQSATLEGRAVAVKTTASATQIRIRIEFPKSSLGFDSSFFGFKNVEETFNVPASSIIEFYTGKVRISLGVNS
jgi:hypothetical protein